MKKYLIVIISILFISNSFAQDSKSKKNYNRLLANSCFTEIDANSLSEKYQELKAEFEKYFIDYSVDDLLILTNDGIGNWDDSTCSYEYAGYNLPVYSYDLKSGKYSPRRHFGETPVRMGQLLAVTCLDYDFYKQSGDVAMAKKALNKIFLLLQAYRRLDMMGNKLMEVYYRSCNNSICPAYRADVSGYTGFIVRDDVPYDFPYAYDDHTPLCYQSDVADSDMTRLLNGMTAEGLVGGDPSFCEMACFFPANEQKDRGGNKNTVTQDQLIGILQGLIYVKRFIPENEATVYVGSDMYNVLAIAKKIAHGINQITKGCSNNMMFPSCLGCDAAVNAKNAGVAIYYYGIAHTVEYITGEKSIINPIEKIGWSLSAGVESFLGLGQQHNIRMYNKLSTYADLTVVSETLEDALQAGNIVTPLESIIFHKNYTEFDGDKNPFDGNAPIEWRDRYCTLLQTYPQSTLVNISKNDIARKYKINDNANDYWCNGSPLESNLDYCNRNSVFSPLEFLYMYNIIRHLQIINTKELK